MWKDFLIGDYFEAINTGNILNKDIADGAGTAPFVTVNRSEWCIYDTKYMIAGTIDMGCILI